MVDTVHWGLPNGLSRFGRQLAGVAKKLFEGLANLMGSVTAAFLSRFHAENSRKVRYCLISLLSIRNSRVWFLCSPAHLDDQSEHARNSQIAYYICLLLIVCIGACIRTNLPFAAITHYHAALMLYSINICAVCAV
jgi:hypothetical protein